jgi:alkylation response protein AidB-like acyl-CoA dehydrogenase
MELGREDLSLARLAEAHFDAVSILAEAGRTATPGAVYGVWASEAPGSIVTLSRTQSGDSISGSKMFSSGAGIIDRALVTVDAPNPYLIDVDLRSQPAAIQIDAAAWKSAAFALTNTATVHFNNLVIPPDAILHAAGLNARGWYLTRPGFWHGACGPAACWAGGAEGLVDHIASRPPSDPHGIAHFAALSALVWQMKSSLDTAGREIDAAPSDARAAHIRALTLRHLIEQSGTEILRRFARVCGPRPLAFDEAISRRYQELDLYLRQSHAERDLEALGNILKGED